MDRTVESFVEEGINSLKERYARSSNESVKKIAEDYIALFEELFGMIQKSTLKEMEKESVYNGFLVMLCEKNELVFKDLNEDNTVALDDSSKLVEEMEKIKLYDSVKTIKQAFVIHTNVGMNRYIEVCENTLCYDKNTIEEFNRFKEEFESDYIKSCWCCRNDLKAYENFMGQTYSELDKYLR